MEWDFARGRVEGLYWVGTRSISASESEAWPFGLARKRLTEIRTLPARRIREEGTRARLTFQEIISEQVRRTPAPPPQRIALRIIDWGVEAWRRRLTRAVEMRRISV